MVCSEITKFLADTPRPPGAYMAFHLHALAILERRILWLGSITGPKEGIKSYPNGLAAFHNSNLQLSRRIITKLDYPLNTRVAIDYEINKAGSRPNDLSTESHRSGTQLVGM